YILPLGGANTAEILAALERSRGEIRRLVTAVIDLKFSPELHFAADPTYDRMDEARRLLGSDAVRRDLDGKA
ncbi:MAG TPA: ribosome-binding factor A, partial [Paracoccaceae bacterium]|nr:ribosome-binding factor A [Paracoccaceae bacterium]